MPPDSKLVQEHPCGLKIWHQGTSAWPLYFWSPNPIAVQTVLVKEEGGSTQSEKPADNIFVDVKIRATTPIVYNDKASSVFVCVCVCESHPEPGRAGRHYSPSREYLNKHV